MKIKAALLIASACAIAGCKVDTSPEAQQQLQQNAENAWKTTKEKSAELSESISKSTAQAKETSRIKLALSTSDRVDTSHLTVETIDHTIYLKGSVPTQEDKDTAVNMAKAIANKGYTVSEDLKVDANTTSASKSNMNTRISDDQPVNK